jgi:hypothetical protein
MPRRIEAPELALQRMQSFAAGEQTNPKSGGEMHSLGAARDTIVGVFWSDHAKQFR